MASHTKLKFRQPGQGTSSEVERRDLRLELERAEKKHKAGGKDVPEDAPAAASAEGSVDEQAAKRRKLIQEAALLDKDDSDDDDRPSAPKAVDVSTNGDAADGARSAS